MSARKKQLPPPSGDALGDAMRRRLQREEEPEATEAAPENRTGATGATGASPAETRTSVTSATSASPATVRRSWYMPADSAAALSALVDDMHHETRRPKGEVLAAIIATVLEHRADVRARLGE